MEYGTFRTGCIYLAKPQMLLDRGFVLFSFKKSDELYKLVYKFNSGALVDVREYTEALKASMFSLKSSGGQ
jgi:hypothetical protein